VLYVAPGGKKSAQQYEEAILKDIVALAETYQMKLRTAVRSDVTPEEAIMKETERRKHNFIIMGAGRRPGEKPFFGDTTDLELAWHLPFEGVAVNTSIMRSGEGSDGSLGDIA
jgi:nucleotide-binding universal stress UspA family protein